jgi:CDP-diacylglycerol--serine O-phosphatidyltransferase
MKQIPNLFTLLNLVFGCIAIVFILQTGESIVLIQQDGYSVVNLPEKMAIGSFFILAAAVVDFLDGFVARLFKSVSAMGKQLDSLADVVSFGVAPGLIMYQLLRISYVQQENGLDVSIGWLLPAFIIPCAAAWRLARFNIDATQQYSFKGLPAPAGGLFVAALPLIIWFKSFEVQEFLINKWLLYAIVLIVSFLMVSTLPMMGMKFKDFGVKNNLPKYLLVAIAAIAAVIFQWLAIPVILLAYVLLSLLFKNKSA